MKKSVGESARPSIVSWIARFILASSILVPLVASSSAGRSNYNVYNYDQTTPQFTPDGRLLQVEYASSAADLSAPLVVLEFVSSGTANDDEALSTTYPCTVLITVPKQPFSPQNRIAILNKQDDQKSTYCVAMSGILADSLALLQAGFKTASEHSLQYRRALDMESFVQVLADECQSRVFAGGLRPYGSTLLLCGYDADNTESSFRSLIYQTDPSGGILQHTAQSIQEESPKHISNNKKQRSYSSIRTDVRCIVGGSPGLQRQLHKQIQQGMARCEQKQRQRNRKELTLADRIASVAKILIKETTETSSTTSISNNGSGDRASNGRTKSRSSTEKHPLEVVIISPRLGCHRLEGKQLEAIQELINIEK